MPLLTEAHDDELGGISPLIVVPGDWSDADIQYQAEHIATSSSNNSGHNCIATQVLVLPELGQGRRAARARARGDAVAAAQQLLPEVRRDRRRGDRRARAPRSSRPRA
ncbi:MAG: aldehyde dehydrogenase family protein [Candidatus Nanopelagicales bacterium]